MGDLSAVVAKLVRRHGRSPASATSWPLDDDLVITALEGFMTPSERALADEYVTAAEGGLGREVIAHRSEVMPDSGICLEIFLLGAERGGPGAIAPAPASSPAGAGAPLLNAGWHRPPWLSLVASRPEPS
jgi:hypothetical protein